MEHRPRSAAGVFEGYGRGARAGRQTRTLVDFRQDLICPSVEHAKFPAQVQDRVARTDVFAVHDGPARPGGSGADFGKGRWSPRGLQIGQDRCGSPQR